MNSEKDEPTKQLEEIMDQDERVLWFGSPAFLPFVLKKGPGLVWLTYSVFAMLVYPYANFKVASVLLIPVLIGIGKFLLGLSAFRNTHYAYTNKRLIFLGEVIDNNYRCVDLCKISRIEVERSPVDVACRVGTVTIYEGVSKHSPIKRQLISVRNPFDVFMNIRKINSNCFAHHIHEEADASVKLLAAE